MPDKRAFISAFALILLGALLLATFAAIQVLVRRTRN
jgi:hypothetical protein